MMNNLTLPAIFAATLDSGLRRNDGMGFACLRANTHRQAGMTVQGIPGTGNFFSRIAESKSSQSPIVARLDLPLSLNP